MSMNDAQTETAAQEIIAAAHQQIRAINNIPLVLLPEGFRVEDMEHMLPAPTRKKGTVVLNDEDSFIAVVNDQKNPDTRLFSTIKPPTFTAVFNHTASGPGWGDHRAKYNAPLSPEWVAWSGQDGKQVSQVDLAQFIENNLLDVVDPDGATLLEICRTLEAKKKVNFSSSIRLSDGSNQFTFEEEVQGSAQKGTLSVPEQFAIGVPIFENGEKWKFDVRLRFRISEGGKLTMWIELVRPHKVIEEAVKEMRIRISAGTELAILNGAPA